MRSPVFAGLGVAVLVIGIRIGGGSIEGYPLVAVSQGVSIYTFSGERVFLGREGTLTLRAFPARSPLGDGLYWCPREQFFVSPHRAELFTADGRWIDGPAPRDLDRYRVRILGEERVIVDTRRVLRARGRSNASISGESGEFYRRWRSDPSKPIGFCNNPLR